MRIVIDYKEDAVLRESFNELTKNTFCFTFRDWYAKGFWGDRYVPHSFAEGDKIVANVSVNHMSFLCNGVQKNYLQLGTVMTDPAYRGQGLSRKLMELILERYAHQVDGIYLFGNDSVLGFYPRFGFRECREYEYHCMVTQQTEALSIVKKNGRDAAVLEQVLQALQQLSEHAAPNPNDGLLMRNNRGLYAFWLMSVYADMIYYIPEQKAYVIAEQTGPVLQVYQVAADGAVDMQRFAKAVSPDITEIRLHYTPAEQTGWTGLLHKVEDCTLFIYGEDLQRVERDRMMFPELSHA